MADTARLDWVLAHDAVVETSGETVYLSFTSDGMRHVATFIGMAPREVLDHVMRTHNTERAGD